MSNSGSRRAVAVPTHDNQYLLTELNGRNGNTAIITPRSTPATKRGQGTESEKQPFLSSEPVSLMPAWEQNDLPNDELNLKEVTMERAELEINPPKDRWNLVYFTLLLHGIGTLTPWNMFITPKAYFVDYKLNGTSNVGDFDSSSVIATTVATTIAAGAPAVTHGYDTYFMNCVAFAAQIPNLLFNWINIFMQIGGNLTTRIVWSLIVMVIIFVVTVVLAMVDSSEWKPIFFWVTMVSVVILNMANGVFQNTVYGMGAKLPPSYTGAIVLGSNISGTFTAVVDLICYMMSPNIRTAAIYYFITALLVLLACFDTYFALPLNRFYRYHELFKEKESRMKVGAKVRTPYLRVLNQCKMQCFNVFFTFVVTLALFPAVQSDVKKSSKSFLVPDDYYSRIMCFVTFNVCAMVGSFLSTWIRWPSRKYLIVGVVVRLAFVPLFLLCNYQPKFEPGTNRVLPVLIDNDWAFWVIAILMGITSGHFSSLAMQYCPSTVEPKHQATAGMFGAAFLITGIFTGILVSMVFPFVVSSPYFAFN